MAAAALSNAATSKYSSSSNYYYNSNSKIYGSISSIDFSNYRRNYNSINSNS